MNTVKASSLISKVEITSDGIRISAYGDGAGNAEPDSKHLKPVCEYCGSVFAGNEKRCASCGAPRAYI